MDFPLVNNIKIMMSDQNTYFDLGRRKYLSVIELGIPAAGRPCNAIEASVPRHACRIVSPTIDKNTVCQNRISKTQPTAMPSNLLGIS